MNRILISHHGQRGDLAINLPAIEYLHSVGDVQIDMPIHRQFGDMLPLFANHPALNACVITDEYERFPSEIDSALLKARGYHMVYNPMMRHRDDLWHQRMHQTSCVLYDYVGQELPLDAQQINLVKWFDVPYRGETIAFAPFAGNYAPGNPKALSFEKAQAIVNRLGAEGWGVFQIGGPDEPLLSGALRLTTSYFDSVRAVLGCRALIHTDTGMGWIASGYKHPQLGLYSHAYYGEDKVHNIQPRNPNGVYLSAANVNEIPVDLVVNRLKMILA